MENRGYCRVCEEGSTEELVEVEVTQVLESNNKNVVFLQLRMAK